MQQLPAIVIGGPPHSGKSVLTYNLTHALRGQGVAHYVVRACPDGEGDWSQEAPPSLVRLVRNKGQFSQAFIARLCRDLDRRHLPLLVDVGGRPTPDQEAIFNHCTHAVLLAPDDGQMVWWRELAERHGLIILAELRSSLTEPETITAFEPILQGVISGLDRGASAGGPIFATLCARLGTILTYSAIDLRHMHLSQSSTELTVDLADLAQTLGIRPDLDRWTPAHLSQVLDYLPAGEPLALYGRGPNWLYAAVARHAWPASFDHFDPRLGWVAPPSLPLRADSPIQNLTWRWHERSDHLHLELTIPDRYLDFSEIGQLSLPYPPRHQAIVFSGPMPHWLVGSLVRSYWDAPWLALYQVGLGDQAVVVASGEEMPRMGDLVQVQPQR